jgi:hypothetical protein
VERDILKASAYFAKGLDVNCEAPVTCFRFLGPRIAGKFQFSGAAIRGR